MFPQSNCLDIGPPNDTSSGGLSQFKRAKLGTRNNSEVCTSSYLFICVLTIEICSLGNQMATPAVCIRDT